MRTCRGTRPRRGALLALSVRGAAFNQVEKNSNWFSGNYVPNELMMAFTDEEMAQGYPVDDEK